MAQAKEKEESRESVDSILGKIKNIVTGKEKVTVDEEDVKPAKMAAEDEEPMELTEIVETEQSSGSSEADLTVLQEIAESLKHMDPVEEKSPKPEAQAQTGPQPQTEAQPKAEEEKFVDVLQEIDQSLEQKPAPQVQVATPVNANVAQEPVQNEPILPPKAKKEFAPENSQNIINPQVVTNMAEEKTGKLLSEDIAAKSSQAIQSLINNIPRPDINSPAFRSAVTLEDIVHETMKPLLKEWLDQNLETIVRDIVEREIKKIIPRE